MGNFLPLSIKLVDGKAMSVSSICEAEVALQGQWPNKAAAPYKDACRLIAAAKEGSCKPSIAFAAFKAAAIDQRLLLPAAKSAALKMLDDVSGEIRRYDEAVISRSTNPCNGTALKREEMSSNSGPGKIARNNVRNLSLASKFVAHAALFFRFLGRRKPDRR